MWPASTMRDARPCDVLYARPPVGCCAARSTRGVANSRFGVVVLSPAFFGRGWPEYELDGLVTRTVAGEQVLLPVWHNVTKREVMGYAPSLADRVARSTATHTAEEIAAEIVDVIRNPPEG